MNKHKWREREKEIENENGDANGMVDTSSTSLISIRIYWVPNLYLTKKKKKNSGRLFGFFYIVVSSIIKWNCIKLVFDIQHFIPVYGQLKIREVHFGSKFFLSFCFFLMSLSLPLNVFSCLWGLFFFFFFS